MIVVAIKNFLDLKTKTQRKQGETWQVDELRASQLIERGLVEVTEKEKADVQLEGKNIISTDGPSIGRKWRNNRGASRYD